MWATKLSYAESDATPFFVPDNVYLLGMMNTADRSLSLVDYALRRRFAFGSMEPKFDHEAFAELLRQRGVDDGLIERLKTKMTELNRFIADKSKSGLGAGFCIGHSFFVPPENERSTGSDWYDRVISAEIIPLLEEYWFDNDALLEEWRKKLITEL